MNACCEKFPAPTTRFVELSTSIKKQATLYQCSVCGNLFEILECSRMNSQISHSEARAEYEILSNPKYLNEIDWKRINNLDDELKSILNAELKRGSKIVETSEGWPSPDSILVILSKPFREIRKAQSVTYHEINDPYYWKAEYRSQHKNHILACKF